MGSIVDGTTRGVNYRRRTTGGRRLWVPRDGGIPVARARLIAASGRASLLLDRPDRAFGCARAPGPLRLRPSPSAPHRPGGIVGAPLVAGQACCPEGQIVVFAGLATCPEGHVDACSPSGLNFFGERRSLPLEQRGADDAPRATRGPTARDAGGGAPGLARSRKRFRDKDEGAWRGPKLRCGEHVPRGCRRREGPTADGHPSSADSAARPALFVQRLESFSQRLKTRRRR